MQIEVLRLPENISRWDLVVRFLRFRKAIFMDDMCWSLINHEGMEFEQYDALTTPVYIVAHEGGEVRGGARLVRTDATIGRGRLVYTYMIRDAWRDVLPGLPAEICDVEPPVSSKVWELTRLTAGRDAGLARDILNAANDWLKEQSAETCLFLGPPAFMRMAKAMGYEATPLGPVTGNADGRFLAFACPVIDRAKRGPARGPARAAATASDAANIPL